MAGIVSYCFFCGLAGPAGSSCSSCLVPIPRPSPEVAASFGCPRCSVHSASEERAAVLLPIGIAPQATIHACSKCHGIFIGARAWCTLVARPELAHAIHARLPPRTSTASHLIEMLRCPACPRQMERGRFGASSKIVIDVCVEHGLWLDAGEVVSIADHAALRANVGVAAARRATDMTEGPADPQRMQLETEALERTARAASRTKLAKLAKRTGLGILLGLVALRGGYMIYARYHGGAPPEMSGAGESAASAATALRNR